ncbi:MAG: phosphoglucosamine mutase [Phycisphaerales bacterium]|nr:phosphoglucosamine mutase [Phycisphaerales bacterium]
MPEAPLMIGISGLRGIVGTSLTPDVASNYARAFGSWLRERHERSQTALAPGERRPTNVVLAADGRAGHEIVVRAAVLGLRSAGCEVTDIGVAATPTAGVMADHLDAAGAMIATASHNPQEWNGLKALIRTNPVIRTETDVIEDVLKFFPDACAPPAALAQEIIERYRAGSASTSPAALHANPGAATRIHVDAVTGGIPWDIRTLRQRRFRVVVDSVNSSGIAGSRDLMARLGVELIHRNSEPTGIFPHPPEPTRENLASLGAAVTTFNADVGFAQDPDADRLAIIDEGGRYIGEEYTPVLAATALLQAHRDAAAAGKAPAGGVVAVNLSTSRMIDDVARVFHARVVRTAVGEANVVEAMKREAAAGNNVLMGGEGNGGVIWPRVTYVRDSISGMALILALMARTGRTLSDLVSSIPSYAIDKRKVDLARKEDARPAVDRIATRYGSAHAAIDLQDGVRVDWPQRRAWLHVRASNTEPIMRLIAEAPGAAEAAAILDDAAAIIAH